MITDKPGLLDEIRGRFAHVDTCPFTGPRVFFENAGGALTLKSVVETSAKFAAIPDNQGRDNPASKALMDTIARAKADMRTFFNAPDGQFFVGESGTEVLFRLIRNAVNAAAPGGKVIGSTLEHPASRSALAHWAEKTGREHILVAHDDATGTVGVEAYRAQLSPDLRVATILHTSPVTGMSVDVAAIAAAIREAAPDCLIVVDGIQHASHGHIDIAGYGIDGYAVSPYKVFSRHGYGIGWASDRLSALPKEQLHGGPAENWELGTRDTGAYATFSDVVDYFAWLGSRFTDSGDRRRQIEAAAQAIHDHEKTLTDAMLYGTGNQKGLTEMPGVGIIGGVENPAREGLVSLTVDGVDTLQVVAALNDQGIRTHSRKADHYSGNVLTPLGLPSCVRVSLCHYNSLEEVAQFLAAMAEITGDSKAG
ncbi:MAG: aminotransferase class V-fold PLP-dependent enzyme [Kiloniellaceae bacterium]